MFTWSLSNVLFWESTLQHKKRFWRKHDWPNTPPTLFYHASPCLHNLYGRAAVNVFYFESHTLFYQTWFWSLGNLHFWKFFINMTKTLTWLQQHAWSSIPSPNLLVTLHAFRWIVYRMFARILPLFTENIKTQYWASLYVLSSYWNWERFSVSLYICLRSLNLF